MDHDVLRNEVARRWADEVVPSLRGLIEIPAVSPAFDAEWAAHGHLRHAAQHVREWAVRLGVPGLTAEVLELDGRSPVVLVEVPATAGDAGTTLIYGHLDKQPPLGDWSDGLGPWQPVVRGDRLYGRGSVDDGYSGYAALAAVAALRAAGGAHGRLLVLLETGEESGSPDLPSYLDAVAGRLGDVALVIGLDSMVADNDRLWLTTSLRGALVVDVSVRVAAAATHSGVAGGIVPDPFRVLRAVLDRIEDGDTGVLRLTELTTEIPPQRVAEASALAAVHPEVARPVKLAASVRPVAGSDTELILNNTWRPALTVAGLTGLPSVEDSSAVQQGSVSARLVIRLPPTVRASAACAAVRSALSTDVPHGAAIEMLEVMLIDGWHAPEPAPWLESALTATSNAVFGLPPGAIGVSGGIPFIGMLGRRYPSAQFVVTGAADAQSNMHGLDESLNLAYARRLTEAIATLLHAQARQ
jgi:acetylornithine deacetylase/succinyl-diaminopimelate desuccinylase-like protein